MVFGEWVGVLCVRGVHDDVCWVLSFENSIKTLSGLVTVVVFWSYLRFFVCLLVRNLYWGTWRNGARSVRYRSIDHHRSLYMLGAYVTVRCLRLRMYPWTPMLCEFICFSPSTWFVVWFYSDSMLEVSGCLIEQFSCVPYLSNVPIKFLVLAVNNIISEV